jgi:hypothetical protein
MDQRHHVGCRDAVVAVRAAAAFGNAPTRMSLFHPSAVLESRTAPYASVQARQRFFHSIAIATAGLTTLG